MTRISNGVVNFEPLKKKSDATERRQILHELKANKVKILILIVIWRANACKLRSPLVTIAILQKDGTNSTICNSSNENVSNNSYLLLEKGYNIREPILGGGAQGRQKQLFFP